MRLSYLSALTGVCFSLGMQGSWSALLVEEPTDAAIEEANIKSNTDGTGPACVGGDTNLYISTPVNNVCTCDFRKSPTDAAKLTVG